MRAGHPQDPADRHARQALNIVGLSGLYHDAAACLLRDGELVAAVQEGRLTGLKNDSRMPVEAWRWCLQSQGLTPDEIDCVAWYERPEDRLSAGPDPRSGIREQLGFEGPIHCFDHHQSHAASAAFLGPWGRAAVLTADAVGGAVTTTHGMVDGARLSTHWRRPFPHSLGLLYSAVTRWLGFAVLTGEAKVMGLAAYGEPRYRDRIRALLRPSDDFELDMDCFDFRQSMFTAELCRRLGGPPRDGQLETLHRDIAASLQAELEDLLLVEAQRLHEATGLNRLYYAGGVALNCVANGRLLADGPFRELWVQPAAGDAGTALGAAALAHVEMTGERPRPMAHAFLGPVARPEILDAVGWTHICLPEDALLDEVVARLAAGQVLGFCHGALEFGPRALGHRSFLADPRRPGVRQRLSEHIKRREWFRPLAPAILEEAAPEWCEPGTPSPYMLRTVRLKPGLPEAAHVDGSARLQTVDLQRAPRFLCLLKRWQAHTGCPALINTSFNVRGAPIAATGTDALRCLASMDFDALVLGDRLVEKGAVPPQVAAQVAATPRPVNTLLNRDLYTL